MSSYEETEEIVEVYHLSDGIMVEKKIHGAWQRHQELPQRALDEYRSALGKEWKPWVGQYHYIYTSDKGRISLVDLPDCLREDIRLWEIYSLKGDLFEDVERYDSKADAEVRIKELLA
jgi:hypothetical protein